MKQITNTLLMIRPAAFRMNEQTAVNNYYQKVLDNLLPSKANEQAQAEFDAFVAQLRAVGVQVIVLQDEKERDTPDSIFPNNWISFHEDGTVVLYPMFAENRRRERREDVFEILQQKGFKIQQKLDYTSAEKEGFFLEGTGSLLLDRKNKKAYCALSPRANAVLVREFCDDFHLQPIIFTAYQTIQDKRKPIYHTNVMMCLGETFALICADCIDDAQERKKVLDSLQENYQDIVLITEDQVNCFAGNMLEVLGAENKPYLVMSKAAHQSLTAEQITTLEKHATFLSANLDTIEALGGGSARCMLAEVFLPIIN